MDSAATRIRLRGKVALRVCVEGNAATWRGQNIRVAARLGRSIRLAHCEAVGRTGDEQNPVITGEAGMYCTAVFKIFSRSGR